MNKSNSAWELVIERVDGWYLAIVQNLPNFVVAVIVIILFSLLARWIYHLTNKILRKGVHSIAIVTLFATMLRFVTMMVGVFVALEILNLDKTVTSLLAGVGVVGLALGFAFQDIAANFVSGILITFRQPYKIGDIVQIENYEGEIKSINLSVTKLETYTGIDVHIPNQYMFTKPLKNLTESPKMRLDLEVGISYKENLRKVEALTKQCLSQLTGRIKDIPIDFFYTGFGASSINFEVRVWLHYPADKNYLKMRHEAIILIKEKFDEENISIPFPMRTLEFNLNDQQSFATAFKKEDHSSKQ